MSEADKLRKLLATVLAAWCAGVSHKNMRPIRDKALAAIRSRSR